MKKYKNKLLLSVISLSLINPVAFADTPFVPASGNVGSLYYQLGGENDVPQPEFLDTQTLPLSVGGDVGLGYNCGVFNPKLSISNAINGIQDSAMNIEQQVINNATAAIYDMPLYIVARANHSLYDLLTNQYFNAQNELGVSTKSCQTMQSEIGGGENPYTNWATIAIGDDWKKHMSLASSASQLGAGDDDNQDINVVKQTVETDNGDNGVPWIHHASQSGGGDNAGGQGQPPIEVINDTVIAGYNVMLQASRLYDDTSAPIPTPQNAYLVATFSSPLVAATWIVNVVGDEEITTYPNAPKGSTPGVGLLADVYEDTQTLETQLNNLIDGTTPITLQNLQAVASPSMVLNQEAINAFQTLDAISQSIYVHKLAEAISAERIAEKVRIAKQLLMVGESVPAIYGNQAAQTDIQAAIKKLDDDRNNMTFNNGQTFGAAAEVVEAVINLAQAKAAQAANTEPNNQNEAPLENGAVMKQGG